MDVSALLIIRGIIGLAAGVLAFLWPAITVAALVVIFGAYAVVDGIANIMLGLSHRSPQGRSWAHVVQGIVGIGAGVVTFLWPVLTTLALVILIGAWAIVTGVFEIAAAIRLRRVIPGEWMLALSGVLSLVFGVLVFAFPGAGAVGIAWVLGSYTAAAGVVLIALGFRLRVGPFTRATA